MNVIIGCPPCRDDSPGVALREKLNEPLDGSIAERICWYCRKWSDVQGNRRVNAQTLANAFLDEIRSAETG